MSSTELVPFQVGDVTYQVPVWMKGLRYLSEDELNEAAIQRIYAAPSLDKALAAAETKEQLETYAGETFKILSAGWRPSTRPGASLPIFAVFDAERPDGSVVVITCGAPRVVAALDRAASEKALTGLFVRVVAIKSETTGHTMLSLVKVNGFKDEFPND